MLIKMDIGIGSGGGGGGSDVIKFYTAVALSPSHITANKVLDVSPAASYGTPKYVKMRYANDNSAYVPTGRILINYDPETFEVLTSSSYFSTDGGNTWTSSNIHFIISGNNIKLSHKLSETHDVYYNIVVAYE